MVMEPTLRPLQTSPTSTPLIANGNFLEIYGLGSEHTY